MMVQVSKAGTNYTVLVDGVVHGQYRTRHAAVVAAIALRETLDPVRID